jgi:hypothetical protein
MSLSILIKNALFITGDIMYNNMTIEELLKAEKALTNTILNDKCNGGKCIESIPHEDLKKIAIDIANNKIFTSQHCPQDMIGNVFTLLMFGTLRQYNISSIGLLYEYIDTAGPMCINGYPIFLSHRMLNKKDTRKVFRMVDKYITKKKELEDLL